MQTLDDYVRELRTLNAASDQIRIWYDEGRKLPGYVKPSGIRYIMLLVGADFKNVSHTYGYLDRHHPNLLQNLVGPHGWAVMRTLIVNGRKHVNKAAKEQLKLKMRNKKRRDWRFHQKEGSAANSPRCSRVAFAWAATASVKDR